MAKQPRQPQPTRPKADQQPEPHHIADEPVAEILPEPPSEQNPLTDTGLPVEEQIQKEWDPKKNGGLPTFLKKPARPGPR